MSDRSACTGFVLGAATPTYAVDEGGVVCCANGLLERLFGLPPGGACGRRIESLVGVAMGAEIDAISRSAIRDGRSRRGVGMYRGCWTRARHTPIPDGDGTRCLVMVEPWLGLGVDSQREDGIATEVLASHDVGDLSVLSPREAEVLWFLARDASIPEIAHSLSRSVKTIETHVRSLSAKTGRSGRLALAHLAIERGIAFMSHAELVRVFGAPARPAGGGGG